MRNGARILAIVLVAAGILVLVYGGFTYTKETHDAKVGPVEINIEEKERVRVPMWAGVALVVAGAGLLIVGPNTRRAS